MTLSTAAQATLLLTSYFSKPSKGAAKPLTPTEWGAFAQWLHEQGYTPAELLEQAGNDILHGWDHAKITRERLEALLQRGSSMALALEKWQRSGLWVITRSDPAYPRRLKKRLKHAAPPVLYGCGNPELLNAGGLAVVGSRKAVDEDLTYAHSLGVKATQEAIGVVSGGAKGIDEAAMQGAIQEGGPAIGILSEGLLKSATSSQWRQGLMSGGLVLVSPYYPEASFNTGNAMGRNKYIYCMSDAAVVVHSGTSGGTKAGAEEDLKRSWVPLWVKPTQDNEAGNKSLVDLGGMWCEEDIEKLDVGSLLTTSPTSPSQESSHQPATQSDTELGSHSVPGGESMQDPLDQATDHDDGEETHAQNVQQQTVTAEQEMHGAIAPESSETATLLQATASEGKVTVPGNLSDDASRLAQAPQPDLFAINDESAKGPAEDSLPEAHTASPEEQLKEPISERDELAWLPGQIDFYQLFLSELQRLAKSPITVDDITAETGLHKTQVNAWLKQAVEEGQLKKLNRPVRYRVASSSPAPDGKASKRHPERKTESTS